MVVSCMFRRSPMSEPAQQLYQTIVGHARRPEFYLKAAVPDSLDGRFDMIALHAFFVMYHLKRDQGEGRALSQELFDVMFAQIDQGLRQAGVGDLGISKRVKAMVCAYYGRVRAYERGVAAEDAVLEDALRRNLYRAAEPAPETLALMVDYVRRQTRAVAAQPVANLLAGRLRFEPLMTGSG